MTTHSATNTPYTPIPSTFTYIEKPLRHVYDQYSPGHEVDVTSYLAGMIVYPLVVCAAPVTIVADMTIGIAESVFCTLIRGDRLQDVVELAKKKIVISPLHHLTFVITSLADSAFVFVLWNHNVRSAKFWLVVLTKLLHEVSTPIVLVKDLAERILFLRNENILLRFLYGNKMLHIALQTSFVVKAAWDTISLLSAGQLTFLRIVSPLAATSLYWTYNYTFSQRLIGSFSPSFNHHAFSIFRDRGAPVKNIGARIDFAKDPPPNTTFQDLAFTDCDIAFWETYFSDRSSNSNSDKNRLPVGDSVDGWKKFWTNFLCLYRDKIDPLFNHNNQLYNQFRDDVLAGKPAREILKLPENISKTQVEKAYKTYSLVLHSDKNPTRFDEASTLFKCLDEAKFQLIGKS